MAGAFTGVVRLARVCAYMTPTAAEASLIYLAVDAHGMAWAGKMVTNTPMRLEPRTGATREYPLLLRIQ